MELHLRRMKHNIYVIYVVQGQVIEWFSFKSMSLWTYFVKYKHLLLHLTTTDNIEISGRESVNL